MGRSWIVGNPNLLPAFVSAIGYPGVHSPIVRTERELGEWYARYGGGRSWFKDGLLYAQNLHGQVYELCDAESEEAAYLVMAKRARHTPGLWIEGVKNISEIVKAEKLREEEENPYCIDADSHASHIAMLERLKRLGPPSRPTVRPVRLYLTEDESRAVKEFLRVMKMQGLEQD